ncbi:MAG: hypothetical protein PVI57_17460 [Gemmatimonadota bacterium]
MSPRPGSPAAHAMGASPRGRPRRSPAALAALVALLAVGAPAEAQSVRAQGAWVAGHVGGLTFGLEARQPIGPEPELPLPGRPGGGPIEAPTRRWVLSGMLAGGVNFATPDDEPDVQGLLYAHGGILYRTGSALVTNVGAVVAAYVPVAAVGPAALVEAADVIDLQAGVLHTSRGWMGHTALTVSLRFFSDVVGGR